MTAAVELAKAILVAADVRERSYDEAASHKASEDAKARREAEPGNLYAGLVDYRQFYRASMLTACQTAGPLAQPVYLLLQYTWNDAIGWAHEVLADAGEDIPKGV